MKTSFFLRLSIISIAAAIILGAFGAHALENILCPYCTEIWEKSIFYQLTNSIGIILLIILQKQQIIKEKNINLLLLLMGIILFCGSLYTLAIAKSILNEQHWIKSIMGPLTPIGGTLLITGWIITFLNISKK